MNKVMRFTGGALAFVGALYLVGAIFGTFVFLVLYQVMPGVVTLAHLVVGTGLVAGGWWLHRVFDNQIQRHPVDPEFETDMNDA